MIGPMKLGLVGTNCKLHFRKSVVSLAVPHIMPFTFVDINECLSSPCQHGCTNTLGSYNCYCNQGYVLDNDQHSCRGKDSRTTILTI